MRVDASGIRDFSVDGRDLAIRGQVDRRRHHRAFRCAGRGRRIAPRRPAPSRELQFERLDLEARTGGARRGRRDVARRRRDRADIDGPASCGAQPRRPARGARAARRGRRVLARISGSRAAPTRREGSCASIDGVCRVEFTADTRISRAVARRALPAEWPTESLHAAGELRWPADAQGDLTAVLAGRFDLETEGRDSRHQMFANATVNDGQIELANVQGTGPRADQLFHGSGRVGLVARDYDLTVDYEQVSLAASAVPTPARARLARAWTASARFGRAPRLDRTVPETRRVQWHGNWDATGRTLARVVDCRHESRGDPDDFRP